MTRYLQILLLISTVILVSLVTKPAQAYPTGYPKFTPAPTHGFGIGCDFDRFSTLDPVGGADHTHAFLGGRITSNGITYLQLRKGPTTCTDRTHKTAYWTSVPIRKSTGKMLGVNNMVNYYTAPNRVDNTNIRNIPKGVKLLIGNPSATEPQYGVVDWSCGGGDGFKGGGDNIGNPFPVDCDPNSDNPFVKVEFRGPSCFSGLTQADMPSGKKLPFKSAAPGTPNPSPMDYIAVYPNGYPSASNDCPKEFPIYTVQLRSVIRFHTSNGKGLKLSSGPITGAHFDVYEASDRLKMRTMIDNKVVNQ